jgi:hypothetical protein
MEYLPTICTRYYLLAANSSDLGLNLEIFHQLYFWAGTQAKWAYVPQGVGLKTGWPFIITPEHTSFSGWRLFHVGSSSGDWLGLNISL